MSSKKTSPSSFPPTGASTNAYNSRQISWDPMKVQIRANRGVVPHKMREKFGILRWFSTSMITVTICACVLWWNNGILFQLWQEQEHNTLQGRTRIFPCKIILYSMCLIEWVHYTGRIRNEDTKPCEAIWCRAGVYLKAGPNLYPNQTVVSRFRMEIPKRYKDTFGLRSCH